MERALPPGRMAHPLSVLLFLQQPATHSKERGLEEEGLGEMGGVSNWCLYISYNYMSDGAAGYKATGLAVCRYKFLGGLI